jgi:hypothetical protein
MCCGRVDSSSCSLRHDGNNGSSAITAMPNRRGGCNDGWRLWFVEEDQLVVLQAFDARYGGKRVCILSSRAQSRTHKKLDCFS